MEDLEEISLDDNILGRITHVGMQVDPPVCLELALFLRNNQDVFTWSHKDMLRINPNFNVYRLNVCPSFPPIG